MMHRSDKGIFLLPRACILAVQLSKALFPFAHLCLKEFKEPVAYTQSTLSPHDVEFEEKIFFAISVHGCVHTVLESNQRISADVVLDKPFCMVNIVWLPLPLWLKARLYPPCLSEKKPQNVEGVSPCVYHAAAEMAHDG